MKAQSARFGTKVQRSLGWGPGLGAMVEPAPDALDVATTHVAVFLPSLAVPKERTLRWPRTLGPA
jgi:hypothetical protein